MAEFNEQSLYNDICKIWGEYGAHADVYRTICTKAGLELISPSEESIEVSIRRIYAEENNSKLQTIKRVRIELLDGLGLKQAKDLVEKYC